MADNSSFNPKIIEISHVDPLLNAVLRKGESEGLSKIEVLELAVIKMAKDRHSLRNKLIDTMSRSPRPRTWK